MLMVYSRNLASFPQDFIKLHPEIILDRSRIGQYLHLLGLLFDLFQCFVVNVCHFSYFRVVLTGVQLDLS